MKSHDCHVFIQTLIPLAYCDLLPKGLWDELVTLGHRGDHLKKKSYHIGKRTDI